MRQLASIWTSMMASFDSSPTPGGHTQVDDAPTWWKTGVGYQIYVRSFADSDEDGVGDLRGISSRLDHLAWLGVDFVWLTPITPSPNRDWGYDPSDYCGIDPHLGTSADFAALVQAAQKRNIQILLD